MEDKYRKAYYPEGITMEERLFDEGERCTRTPIYTRITTIIFGFIITVIAVAIMSISGTAPVFWVFAAIIGGLMILIGFYGISMYNHGLRCLERAELLYNTRKASEVNSGSSIQQPGKHHPTISSKKKPQPIKVEVKEPSSVDIHLQEDDIESHTEFVDHILKMSTDDLQLIVEDQQDLYSAAEMAIIQEILAKRLG